MKLFTSKFAAWVGGAVCSLAVLIGLRDGVSSAARAAEPAAEPLARYPYDPVCPWGRVADGQGLLVRCLQAAEASRLLAGSAAPPAASAAPASSATAAPAVAPAASTALMAPALAAAVPAQTAPGATADASVRRAAVKAVSEARADTGDLVEAGPQLRKAEARYVQCVDSNGGLEASQAQVTFRFLVRERGRAEGVTVKDRRGVSLAAARCMADVIDRRYVGYPAAPIVGASLTIELEAARTP